MLILLPALAFRRSGDTAFEENMVSEGLGMGLGLGETISGTRIFFPGARGLRGWADRHVEGNPLP